MMLRIISGKHKGRKIEVPKDNNVRPTADRTREAIFNILMHADYAAGKIQDAEILDVCCGSGAMGFEALSRGAGHVTFIDNSPEVLKTVEQSASALNERSAISLVRTDATTLPIAHKKFDVIFIDPPYKDGLADKILEELQIKGWMSDKALIVVEQGEGFITPTINLRLENERTYGKTTVSFFTYPALD